jgi:CBS domain-containing protein
MLAHLGVPGSMSPPQPSEFARRDRPVRYPEAARGSGAGFTGPARPKAARADAANRLQTRPFQGTAETDPDAEMLDGRNRMKAGDVMTTGAATIRPDASLARAAQVMVEHQISGLPVIDAQDKLVGIISEGDFLRPERGHKARLLDLLASEGSLAADELATRHVEELMTPNPVTITIDTRLDEIVDLMHHHNVKRLPVVALGKVVGIVSRANLLQALLRKSQSAGGPPEPRKRRRT